MENMKVTRRRGETSTALLSRAAALAGPDRSVELPQGIICTRCAPSACLDYLDDVNEIAVRPFLDCYNCAPLYVTGHDCRRCSESGWNECRCPVLP